MCVYSITCQLTAEITLSATHTHTRITVIGPSGEQQTDMATHPTTGGETRNNTPKISCENANYNTYNKYNVGKCN